MKFNKEHTTVGGIIALAALAFAFIPALIFLIPIFIIGIANHTRVRGKK